MKTEKPQRTKNQGINSLDDVVRSLDDIVQRIVEVDHKVEHLIFIHRYDRYAYAQAGQYNSDYGMYKEE